jgi:predicted glutamine amidotransferase
LFAHGHKRTQGKLGIRPPGLHVLCSRPAHDASALDTEGLEIRPQHGAPRVVLVASVPLTQEAGWRALEEGELIAVRAGAIQ